VGIPARVGVDAHKVDEVSASVPWAAVGGIGHGPRPVDLANRVHQALHQCPTNQRIRRALIQDAPCPDAGMAGVTFNHRPQHSGGAIADDVARELLAAKAPQRDLFDKQHTLFVAVIEESLIIGIV